MPPSKLDGREVVEVTEYEHDERGHYRSVTIREPEWTEQDTAELLALAEYRASLCECCGMPKDVVWVHERDAPRFVVKKWPCQARKVLNVSQAAYFGKDQPTPAQQALRWTVQVAP